MVLVPVIGANFLEIVSGEAVTGNTGTGLIFTGFIAAFISGYVACRWMIELVRKSRLIWFAVYCVVAGLVSIILG